MAKYAQIEDLKNGEIFRVVEETAGEVYFYNEDRRWSYFNKSEEGTNYRYFPAGVRLTRRAADVMPCGRKHNKFVWCSECYAASRR